MMPTPPRSGLSSRNSFDANNAFPRQAGHSVSKRDHGLISPARSTFSFADEVEPTTMQKPDLIDENAISGPYGRGSPGDAALMAMVNKDRASTDLSRRKSQFYSEVFAYREPNVTARDRVNRYSVITCEVKTNVIVSPQPPHAISNDPRLIYTTGQRRIYLPPRPLPAPFTEVQPAHLIHLHNS